MTPFQYAGPAAALKAGIVRWGIAPWRKRPVSGDADGINIIGLFSGQGGLSTAANGLRDAAHAVGIPVCATDIRRVPGRLTLEDSGPHFRTTVVHANPDILFDALRAGLMRHLSGRRTVGYWTWETERAPACWQAYAALFDELWAPSSFAAAAIAAATGREAHVLPHVASLPDAEPLARHDFGIAPDAFVFLCAADGRSSMERKNPLGALRAFRSAFGARQDRMLVMKCMHLSPSDEAVLRSEADPNVVFLNETMTSARYAALLRCCDAFVSLHRGEGFGLAIAEAMLAGKPVIATEYGGCTDFLHSGNSFPVRYVRATVGTGCVYPPGTVWCEPDITHAAECLRVVASESDRYCGAVEQGQHVISTRFSSTAIGGQLCRLIS